MHWAGPLGIIGTVPRDYDIFRTYEGTEGRKNKEIKKIGILMHNKVQDFKNTEKSAFLSLCLAK
jgi:hypothetical protein